LLPDIESLVLSETTDWKVKF